MLNAKRKTRLAALLLHVNRKRKPVQLRAHAEPKTSAVLMRLGSAQRMKLAPGSGPMKPDDSRRNATE